MKELQALVARIGGEMEIAPEILAQRRVLEGLVRSYVGRGSRELPAELGGWRREVVGRPAVRGKLLVVDDNEMNRDMLSRRLAREGHTVATAQNVGQALNMVRIDSFDLVLLDVMMSDMDG